MRWLRYLAYLGYVKYVLAVGEAIQSYQKHKSAQMLAAQIANVVYDVLDYITKGKSSKRVERNNVVAAVKSVTDLYIDVMD